MASTSIEKRKQAYTSIEMTKQEYMRKQADLPFGFIKSEPEKLVCYKEESKPNKLIPIEKLEFHQKKKLVIECWDKGFWGDVLIENVCIKKENAVKAVKELVESEYEAGWRVGELKTKEKALGEKLLEVTLTGYKSLYEELLPMNTKEYQLPKFVDENVKEIPKKECSSFAIETNMIINIKFFKIQNNTQKKTQTLRNRKYPTLIKTPNKETPDFIGQVWLATDKKQNTISSFMALPGCTLWHLEDFPRGQFLPSLKPDKDKPGTSVNIKNNLKTYVNLYMVRSTGQLHYLHMLLPQMNTRMDNCHVGYSFVAIQGDTVFSEFQVLNSNPLEWCIGESISEDGYNKILVEGENNYIYYHLKTEQNDTVKPEMKEFEEDIYIAKDTKYLSVILTQSNSTYFKAPYGKYKVVVYDPDGTKHFSVVSAQLKEQFVKKTKRKAKKFKKPSIKNLIRKTIKIEKLCITNPIAGTWKVKLSVQTNTPIFFQLQTAPTQDPYETIRKAFEKDNPKGKASQWKDFVYRGLAGMIIDEGHLAWDYVVDVIGKTAASLLKKGWDLQEIKEIKHCIDLVYNSAAPIPKDLSNILIVDANGEDTLTQDLCLARKEHLKDYVKGSKYRKHLFTLTQVNQEDFVTSLESFVWWPWWN